MSVFARLPANSVIFLNRCDVFGFSKSSDKTYLGPKDNWDEISAPDISWKFILEISIISVLEALKLARPDRIF